MKKKIWAFAGGKGGVGKSIISTNIALLLTEKNNNVVIIDADFGAANVHTCLGIPAPKASLIDFFSDEITSLTNCISPTIYSNLYIISGAQDSLEIANPSQKQITQFIRAIQEINADYIIIDLGAGTSHQIIDIFNYAHKGILVTMPEPTSIENTYRFIKHSVYRQFRKVSHYPDIREYLEKISTHKENQRQISPSQLIQDIALINSEAGNILNNSIKSMDTSLILNQVISNRDIRLGMIIKNSCQKHFSILLKYTGAIESDKNVLIASRERKPVTIYNQFSTASRSIRSVGENLIKGEQLFLSI